MDEKEWLGAMRRTEEGAREAHLVRQTAHKKIAEGHRLLGGATDPSELPSRQTCLKVFDGHKLIAEGHEMLSRAEELLSVVAKTRSEIVSAALEALLLVGTA